MFDPYDTTNPTFSTVGGWKVSKMRQYLHDNFIYLLPRELVAAITPVIKKGSIGGHDASSDTDIQETTDTLWIPALVELGQSDKLQNAAVYSAEGEPYEIYKGLTEWEANLLRIKFIKRAGTNVYKETDYWTRTPVANSSNNYMEILSTGGPATHVTGSIARDVAFGFCIG